MKFKGMLLAVAIVLCTVSPKESKAVGEIGQAVCGTVSSILSMVPSSVGYLDGWKLKCKFTKGCWFEYKCRSLQLADELEKGLTMVCNAITSYGPGFFPGSSLTAINGDLLNIKNEMGNISSIVDISSPNRFDPIAANASMNNISSSLGNIQSLMPSIPGESSKWVKKKSHCKKADGGAASGASAPSGSSSASSEINDYNNAAQAESKSQENAEILATCGKKPDWINDYRTPALNAYNSDTSVWNACINKCDVDYPFQLPKVQYDNCINACGNKPDFVPDYEDPAYAAYKHDLDNVYYPCQEGVTESFEYVPSSTVEGMKNDAINKATGGGASTAQDLINNSSGVCIPQSKVNAMPPEAANNLDPGMICP